MFGWIKKASQKTSLFNVELATKALIYHCNQGYKLSNGEPSALPAAAAKLISLARDDLLKEVSVALNVEVGLGLILDRIQKIVQTQDMSPLAELTISDVVLNV